VDNYRDVVERLNEALNLSEVRRELLRMLGGP
jgi:hypothetical protein